MTRFLIGLHASLVLAMAFCFVRVLFWREPDEFTGMLAAAYPFVALNSLAAICRLAKDARDRREIVAWSERMANIDQEAEQLLAKVEERKQRRDREAGR